ncbi:M23 family metallopeptidase [Selenomonas sp. TAMA-11512]|uniref:murein hydrolase activator EnvC family protein n=1 Tax=Selenomonas sp. TAMA-11512 TaxID=3095337 RepID=UPI003092A5B7|nr:M23 family metallopeptidase [Selenomonas sp. TAMA-11512]
MLQWKKSLAIALSCLMVSLQSTVVLAHNLEEEQKAYEQAAEEAQSKKAEIDAEIENLSDKKRILDEAADAARAAYREVRDELDETEARLEENQEKMEKVEADFKVKKAHLKKRVRDIYINGQISYLDVLFGAKNFQDFFTRMDLLKKVIMQDYDLVQAVFAEKQEIESMQAMLKKDQEIQSRLVEEAAVKKKEADEKQAEVKALIDQMENDSATQERIYNENMAASKQVAEIIRRSSYAPAGNYSSGNGSMIWPVAGPITSDYGWRIHPITGASRFHSGVDIGGDYGDPIYAAAAGVVTYAGWISGYGYTVIIDHGGGISTLYGHSQRVLVSEGQQVGQGTLIAEVGSTGNSTGPHCHFEVRVGDEPTNPLAYL